MNKHKQLLSWRNKPEPPKRYSTPIGFLEPARGLPAVISPILATCSENELGRLFGRFKVTKMEKEGSL